VRGTLLNWVGSYLTNRKKRAMFNGGISNYHNVTFGVIQGYVLGSVLFNVFMSALPICVTSLLVMYADDSTIFRHRDN
jgi:ABC-type Mn2+/Zn2+ transport system permease subunit